MTAIEQLAAYQSHHRIEIDPSGDWTTCQTDGLRVHMIRDNTWRHDASQIDRLVTAAAAERYQSEVDGDGLSEWKRAAEIAGVR